ncbi:MAG: histidinol-phosphate transaminase [Renibacterium sp.]|nr:histidinol-phosphate transaminase [Renibacterium sp.]
MVSTEAPDSSPAIPRPALRRLPRYAAGKPPVPVAGVASFKLSSNENPLPPLPEVLAAISDLESINRYPDPTAAPLRAVLGEFLGVPADDIVTGTGGLGAFNQILAAFAGANDEAAPDEVIYPWRSFEAYPISVGLTGAASVQVPLAADGRHDLPAMAAAITERTKVIVLCTPNNPTGPVLHTAEVVEFLDQVPPRIVVVIDEAYTEFSTDPEMVRGLDMYRKYPNVVLLRTFSKAYGLAGLRIGYSISHPGITESLRIAASPFTASAVAQEAAIASIELNEKIIERVQSLIFERERVLDGLRALGWPVPDAQGNFFWLNFGEDSADFAAVAEAAGLSVRTFAGEGVRVSIGEAAANSRLLEICAGYTKTPLAS